MLLAKQQRRRATLPWHARTWGYIQDITVGYGYRPVRAAGYILEPGQSPVDGNIPDAAPSSTVRSLVELVTELTTGHTDHVGPG